MKLSRAQVAKDMKFETEKMNSHLSLRVQSLLEELLNQIRDKSDSSAEVDLFEILVRLVLITDKEPASIIANLMVPLDNGGANDLEEWTLSNAGAFLRDFLRKDYTLCILKSEFDERAKLKSKSSQ
jgi:hypothetical protein